MEHKLELIWAALHTHWCIASTAMVTKELNAY